MFGRIRDRCLSENAVQLLRERRKRERETARPDLLARPLLERAQERARLPEEVGRPAGPDLQWRVLDGGLRDPIENLAGRLGVTITDGPGL